MARGVEWICLMVWGRCSCQSLFPPSSSDARANSLLNSQRDSTHDRESLFRLPPNGDAVPIYIQVSSPVCTSWLVWLIARRRRRGLNLPVLISILCMYIHICTRRRLPRNFLVAPLSRNSNTHIRLYTYLCATVRHASINIHEPPRLYTSARAYKRMRRRRVNRVVIFVVLQKK